MQTIKLTKAQLKSIANYRAAGIDIEIVDPDRVLISQNRLVNGYILNNKQLYDRAREIFPDGHIISNVYSLDVDHITLDWITSRMEEFGLKRKDLIKQLAIDKVSLSKIFNGVTSLSKPMKATFFYYFLTYELNRDLRENNY